VPCGKRLFGEPDRDIATLAQGFVIFGPVGHFVTRFFNLVTAALIVFVRPPSGWKIDLLSIIRLKPPALAGQL
jgi:hypothetical protein